jgi:hypothetical protein
VTALCVLAQKKKKKKKKKNHKKKKKKKRRFAVGERASEWGDKSE